MSQLHVAGNIDLPSHKYSVGLSLIEFEEDGVTIVYSPALDLSGYGNSPWEARASFSEALHEFLRYTSNKKTLETVLKSLGWTIRGSKKRPKYSPPKDSDLVSVNPLYNDIVNNKCYKVSREDVELVY